MIGSFHCGKIWSIGGFHLSYLMVEVKNGWPKWKFGASSISGSWMAQCPRLCLLDIIDKTIVQLCIFFYPKVKYWAMRLYCSPIEQHVFLFVLFLLEIIVIRRKTEPQQDGALSFQISVKMKQRLLCKDAVRIPCGRIHITYTITNINFVFEDHGPKRSLYFLTPNRCVFFFLGKIIFFFPFFFFRKSMKVSHFSSLEIIK